MLRILLEKEFKQILRNPIIPRLILMMPIMTLFIMPWAANSELKNADLAVIDADRSTASAKLVEKIESSGFFNIIDYATTPSNAMQHIESGKADVMIEIAPDFAKNLTNNSNNPPAINIAAGSINSTTAALSVSYLKAIINDFSQAKSPIAIKPRYLYNDSLDYKTFMIPALMVMLLTLLTGFLPALNIVGEKERGTIEQLNVSPITPLQFTLSKLIPYWTIGFIVLTLCYLLAAIIYGLKPLGSYATLYACASIYIITISGFGLVVSNHSQTMQQAMFVMFFFLLIFVLISGLFTPVESMPRWAQTITTLNPLYYLMRAQRAVFLKGSTLADLQQEILSLAAFGAVLNTWALISYKKWN